MKKSRPPKKQHHAPREFRHTESNPNLKKLEARLDKNRKGFGFLIFDGDEEDAFLPAHIAQRFFHGDRVSVSLDRRGEVEDCQLIEHRMKKLVGRYQGDHWLLFERKNAREEIRIPRPGKAKMGDWLLVSLNFHERGPYPVMADIIQNFGKDLPASSDLPIISAEFGLDEDHSDAAVKQAEAYKLDTSDPRRKDMRDIPFITIDGEDARDFDDAIFVERAKDEWVLWVAIADVSHYVKEGTPLDQEAFSRGTSVYFPERAFHMLPRALSENLCSLRPHEPRLAMVAKIHYGLNGKPGKTELFEATIESRRRATYNEIHKEYLDNHKSPKWEFAPHFELYEIIKKARHQRGSIDFDLQEIKVRVDKNAEPVEIEVRERLESHRLIEEFMIAANEAVTEWMLKRKNLFIFRVHEDPDARSFQKFQRLAKSLGINFHLLKDQAATPQQFSALLKQIEGHPAQAALNSALLRSMKQAIYSAEHSIHFGLASNGYTHFTSPIRRYPDLIVHRLLRAALRNEAMKGKSVQALLEKVATHCSQRERIAAEAERESIKLKQVRALKKHTGDELPGKITGLVESGFFVQLLNPVAEGFVHKDTIGDDVYFFDEDKMMLYGRRKRRMFRIGDPVIVKIVLADVERRRTDMALISAHGKNSTDRKKAPH